MRGYLSDAQIDYVLHHLGHTLILKGKLKDLMVFNRAPGEGADGGSEKILFQMSDREPDIDSVKTIEGLPVLFPLGPEKRLYSITGRALVFHHDLIKSCFYLLSGFQELHPEETDPLGRFPYSGSIQEKCGFIHRPLVNEYFEVITRGIKEFAAAQGLPAEERHAFREWAFFLSHDVDSIDTYTWYEAGYRIKQLMGLVPSDLGLRRRFRIASRYCLQRMNFVNRVNAHWDFEFLRQLEEDHGFSSTWFFLPKDQLHQDAYYTFDEPRVVKLFDSLNQSGCEIGIHGTVRSSGSLGALRRDMEHLKRYSPQEVRGIRQHRLLFDREVTHSLHEQAGLLYDTSMGFAQHEGFRNSYCLPFRPWDHGDQRMMETWEIPLVVMDVTLFNYRKLGFEEAFHNIGELVNQVIRFHGVFSLLWHNGQCDEFLMPGIRGFLGELIHHIADRHPESLTGDEIARRFELLK